MSTTDKDGWRHTSPLAVIFYAGKILQLIAQNAIQTFAPLVALLFAYQGNLMTMLIFGAIAFAAALLVASFLRYLFFRYKITDDSVLIREGVIKKKQLDIKFDRIQAINTEQNIIYRFFNLVAVTFDTAGSKGQEGHLPAVRPELANSLREKIRRTRAVAPDSEFELAVQEKPDAGQLLSLSNADMVRIGLSDNRALIFLAFLGPLFEQIDNFAESLATEDNFFALIAVQAGFAEGAAMVVMLMIGLTVLLLAASIVGAFLRFHRYRLKESNDVYQSTGGLLTRHVHSINRAKIQTLVITQNIVLRIFGRFRLNARQASSAKQHANKKNFAVPICLPDESQNLSQEFFGAEFSGLDPDPRSPSFAPIARQYLRARTMITAVIPAGIVAVAFSFLIGWYAMWILIWVPFYALVNWRLYKRYGVQVTRDGLALRKGFLGFSITSFLHRKVQRVGVTQTWFQRRKGLATLRFYLASGTVRVPYVDFSEASKLRDYVLYRVESSQLAWH